MKDRNDGIRDCVPFNISIWYPPAEDDSRNNRSGVKLKVFILVYMIDVR
jgi:hypothetical protein